MVPPILTPTSSEPRNQVYLPYKYVIFKNTFPDGDWDQGNCFAFDIPSVPFLKSSNDYDNNNTDDNPPLERDTIGLLPEFCQAALSALQSYISTLNSDTDETPDKCKWVIHTVDIGKDEHGVVSCREFGVVLEMIGWAEFVEREEKRVVAKTEAEKDRVVQSSSFGSRPVPVPALAPAPSVWTEKRDGFGHTWFKNSGHVKDFGLPAFP